jgi:hypothetical protein
MYYIKNQNNQIIAADPLVLDLLKVESIDELYKETVLGNISFLEKEEGKITIETLVNELCYTTSSHELSGLLGKMTLVALQTPVAPSAEQEIADVSELLQEEAEESDEKELIEKLLDIDTAKETEEEALVLFDDLVQTETELQVPETAAAEAPQEEEKPDLFEDTIALFEEPAEAVREEEFKEEKKPEISDEIGDELFDLLLPGDAEEMISEISEEQPEQPADTSPIFIDTETICRNIGISADDYNTFLNEYIDTALSLENDLRSTDMQATTNAIQTLSHLSNVLHLPVVTERITEIKNATPEQKEQAIASLYATLSRLTTTNEETLPLEVTQDLKQVEEETVNIADTLDLISETAVEEERETAPTSTGGFGTINLNDVKPIHFDFQLEEAANDLSLPIELIGEFVHDFIAQAHEETEKMLKAYEEGDLETVQKIGHLLKGTSSNLRITPLSETLYKIQFCEDSSKLEALIKEYWGHFLSLENQINLASR